MLTELSREDRLQLMRFVCSFAWADLRIEEKERAFVAKLVKQLDLNADEREQVQSWLNSPPRAEDIDPADVPKDHRELFIDVARAMVVSDGTVSPDEAENLALLEMLLSS